MSYEPRSLVDEERHFASLERIRRELRRARILLSQHAMAVRFWLSAVLFHLCFLATCAVVLRRWVRRSRSMATSRDWLTGLSADAGLLLCSALVLAGLASLVGAGSGFSVLRLLSQGLFGEMVLLTSALAVLLLSQGLRPLGTFAVAAPIGLMGVYAEAYHREPTDLQVRTHALDVDAVRERPLRVLHMSDIQTDEITAYEHRVFREAIALRPDLVLLTGDYVQPRLRRTRARTTAELRPLLRELSAAAPLGVYAVRGDVDPDWPDIVLGTGVRPLTGEAARIVTPGGGSLTLIGVTAGMSRGHEVDDFERLVRGAPPADLRIVFGHNPNFAARLHEKGLAADLVLAGHTHGGQVVLPLIGAPITKMNLPRQYASGLHDYHGLALHVSAGIGLERGAAPQLRFRCPPEICLLELR